MVSTGRAIQALVSQVSELTSQFQRFKVESTQQPPAHNPPAVPDASRTIHSAEPRLPPPTVYSGEPHLCRPFLAKCSLYFPLQPSSFPTEESKIAFAFTLLSGRAALWGTTVWDNKHQCFSSFQAFSSELRKVFDLGYGRVRSQTSIRCTLHFPGKQRAHLKSLSNYGSLSHDAVTQSALECGLRRVHPELRQLTS